MMRPELSVSHLPTEPLTASHQPVTSRGSWQFTAGLLSISTFMEVIAMGHLEAFTPLFLEHNLGVPDSDVPRWTGLLAAATMAVAMPFAPFWGVLADRYNRKLIILRSLLIGSVAYAVAALSTDVWQFLGMKLLFGLTFASHGIVVGAIAFLAPDKRIGLAIGLIQMMMPLGRSIGPVFGSWLIAQFGLRGMFAADALLTGAAFTMLLLLLREPPKSRDSTQSVLGRLGTVTRLILWQKAIRLLFILNFAVALMNSLINPFVPVAIDRVYEGENVAFVIGLTLAGYGGLAAVSAPIAGRLGDRFGPERVLLFAMIGLGLMAFGLTLATTPLQIALVVMVGAVPFGAQTTSGYSLLARIAPREHMVGIMGLSPMARNAAMLIGPLIGAAVAGIGLWAVFAAATVTSTVAVGLNLMLVRTLAAGSSQDPTVG